MIVVLLVVQAGERDLVAPGYKWLEYGQVSGATQRSRLHALSVRAGYQNHPWALVATVLIVSAVFVQHILLPFPHVASRTDLSAGCTSRSMERFL